MNSYFHFCITGMIPVAFVQDSLFEKREWKAFSTLNMRKEGSMEHKRRKLTTLYLYGVIDSINVVLVSGRSSPIYIGLG